MKKFIQTIRNIFAIKELRTRIINTLILLLVFRLGANVVLPGIDPSILKEGQSAGGNLGGTFGGLSDMLNLFLGGAFSKAAIFALGIMPYISASIVIQLLTFAVPQFQKMQKEGESGRKKINNYTRLLTIALTFMQATGYITATIAPEAIVVDKTFFTISSVIILTSGTIFTMWLGEKITERGIGNGISMLIMIGIISALPISLAQEAAARFGGQQAGPLVFILEMVFLFVVVMGVVALTQAVRKIPVQYAKQVIGNKVYGGQRQSIPLKVNAAGVMPIIFAQSLMFLPSLLANIPSFRDTTFGTYIGTRFADYTSLEYNIVFALLIILFTYFYTAVTVNPKQIAEDMRRNNGFIPGVKPGEPTSEYIDSILSKITLPGSFFLAVVAILPAIAVLVQVQPQFSQFYGGTSLLIMVGVILDTLQQINSYLLMQKYEGIMKSGKVKGRSSSSIAVA